MTSNPNLMPAPRPRGLASGLLNAETAKALVDANADLGFKRASTSPVGEGASAPDKTPEPLAVPQASLPQAEPVAPAQPETQLRIAVPDDVAVALKIASIHRRASVRYLILEALHKAGYPVDLDAIPEDGRRR